MHEISSLQPEKIARKLNSGLIVVETEAVAKPVASGSFLSSLGGFLSGKPAAKQHIRWLPYDEEQEICVLETIILEDDYLKFCDITGVRPGLNFKGTPRETTFSDCVKVYSRRPIRGFHPWEHRNAIVRFVGGKKRARAIVEDLIPITSN